jgi:hypothetical protein
MEGNPMTEAEWLAFDDLEKVRDALMRLASPRKLRLFVTACLRDCPEVTATDAGLHIISLNETWAESPFPDVEWDEARSSIPRETFLWKTPFERVLFSGVRLDGGWAAVGVSWGTAFLFANTATNSDGGAQQSAEWVEARSQSLRRHFHLLGDIFGNPFRPASLDPVWLTSDVLALARGSYNERAFDRMPILADALQDAGCTNEDVLAHCRDAALTHVRGCWVVDLLLGKE